MPRGEGQEKVSNSQLQSNTQESLVSAAQQLIELLDGLPNFDPCRGPVEAWPEHTRQTYFPVWDLASDYWRDRQHDSRFQPLQSLWCAFGDGRIITLRTDGITEVSSAPGCGLPDLQAAVSRVLNAKANSVPNWVREGLLSGWQSCHWISRKEPEVLIRNVWYERELAVAAVKPGIEHILPLATRAVNRVGGKAEFLHALKTDKFLHFDTVDGAVAQLRAAIPPEDVAPNPGAPPKGFTAMLTGRRAAEILGVTASTLSRWRSEVPSWAADEKALFQHLIDREGSYYHSKCVRKLAAWYEAAQEHGGQSPVPCP